MKSGDQITVIHRDVAWLGRGVHTDHAVVRSTSDGTELHVVAFRFNCTRDCIADLQDVVVSSHEDVSWIRGHHADDSPEVAALVAAYALARGRGAA